MGNCSSHSKEQVVPVRHDNGPRARVQEFDSDGKILLQVAVEGNIAFILVRYLRHLSQTGEMLPRRQLLPEGSFVAGEKALTEKYLPRVQDCYGERVMMKGEYQLWGISHGWLSAEHPDPTGQRVKDIIHKLDRFGASDDDALFFDYLSLPQIDKLHPDYQYGKMLPAGHPALKTDEEIKTFAAAMSGMDKLYASSVVRVLIMEKIYNTDLIGTRPDGKPYQINGRPYDGRGWCKIELTLSSTFGRIANIRDVSARPLQNVDPATFRAAVDSGELHFTSQSDDKVVEGMFKRYYFAGHLNILIRELRSGNIVEVDVGIHSALRALQPEVRVKILGEVVRSEQAIVRFAPDLVERLKEDFDKEVLRSATDAVVKLPPMLRAKALAALSDRAMSSLGIHREATAPPLANVAAQAQLPAEERGTAFAALEKLAGDKEWTVLQAAARSLGPIVAGPLLSPEERARAAAMLLKVAGGGDSDVRKATANALDEQALVALVQAPALPLGQAAAAPELPTEQRANAVAALCAWAQDKECWKRQAAAPLLAKVAAQASLASGERGTVLAALEKLAGDEDWFVRKAFAGSLGPIAAGPSLPAEERARAAGMLLKLAGDGDSRVRQAAAGSLGPIAAGPLLSLQEGARAAAALLKLAGDDMPYARQAVMRTMRANGLDEQFLRTLVQKAAGGDDPCRKLAR